jgi:hypothetical protein
MLRSCQASETAAAHPRSKLRGIHLKIKRFILAKFKSKLFIDLKFLISRLFINVKASSIAPFVPNSTF